MSEKGCQRREFTFWYKPSQTMYKTTEKSKKSGTSRNFVYTRRRDGARVISDKKSTQADKKNILPQAMPT